MLQVRKEIELDAVREDVWAALTREGLLAQWLADDATLDAEPGGEVRFGYDDGEERCGVVERVEDGELLTFRWRRADAPETRVELRLADAVSGTRLIVTEVPVEAGVPVPVALAGEWSPRLRALEQLLRCVLQPLTA